MSIRHQTHHIWKFHTSLQFSVHPQFLLVLDWSSAQIKFRKKTKENVLHRFGILPLGDSGRKVVEKWVGDSLAEWPSHLSYFVFLS